jgi:hypothetical protein
MAIGDSQLEQDFVSERLPATTPEPKKPLPTTTLPAAQDELNITIEKASQADELNPRYIEKIAMIAKTALGLSEKATLEHVLEYVKTASSKLTIYFGGIGRGINTTEENAGTGLTDTQLAHNQEVPTAKLDTMLAGQIISKDKNEQTANATTFLTENNTDVVISLEPKESANSASSLRADRITLTTILKELKSRGITPDIVTWSNGGFKLTQLMIAGFWKIGEDISYAVDHGLLPWNTNNTVSNDVLINALQKVKILRGNEQTANRPDEKHKDKKQHLWQECFDYGLDALEFIKFFENSNVIIAASPINYKELALPFKSTHPNPIAREIQNAGRFLVNQAVYLFGTNEGNALIDKFVSGTKISDKTKLLLGRLLEMGRGKELTSEQIKNNQILLMVQNLIHNAIGNAIFAYLSDPEGSVVHSTAGGVPDALNIIAGDKTIYIQTQENLPYKTKQEILMLQARHSELKRPGTLQVIKALIGMKRLGLITADQNRSVEITSRFIPTKSKKTGKTETGAAKRDPLLFRYDDYLHLLSRTNSIKFPLTAFEKECLAPIREVVEQKLLALNQQERVKPNTLREILTSIVRAFLQDRTDSLPPFILNQHQAPSLV